MKCSLKVCLNDGDMVPQLILMFRDGSKDWRFPATFDLPMCAECRKVASINTLLPDGGQSIIARMLEMRPTAKHMSTTLEWVPLTDPEYKRLRGAGPS